MKLRCLSDMHLETKSEDLPTIQPLGADYLVLAGDIHNGMEVMPFLEKHQGLYSQVIYVPGNHCLGYSAEVPGNSNPASYTEIQDWLLEEADKHWWLTVLVNGQTYRNGNDMFVGGTLWTDLNQCCNESALQVKNNMADFTQLFSNRPFSFDEEEFVRLLKHFFPKIDESVVVWLERLFTEVNNLRIYERINHSKVRRTFTLVDWLVEHFKCRLAIEAALNDPANVGTKMVVVTHHAPHFQSNVPFSTSTFKRRVADVAKHAYISDLEYLLCGEGFLRKPDAWIHGHTHASTTYRVGGTPVYSNCEGRPLERGTYNTAFDRKLVVTV